MNKAISPLIAAVLLIAFTMAVAAILATWASSFMAARTGELETAVAEEVVCRGGLIKFLSGYPKMEDNRIQAVVEVSGIDLGNFAFELILRNNSVALIKDSANTTIAPGKLGTIISEPLSITKENITKLRLTSNCSDVKTLLTTLE